MGLVFSSAKLSVCWVLGFGTLLCVCEMVFGLFSRFSGFNPGSLSCQFNAIWEEMTRMEEFFVIFPQFFFFACWDERTKVEGLEGWLALGQYGNKE